MTHCKVSNMKTSYIFLAATMLLAACQYDSYDSGDTSLSYLTTELVDATTNSDALFTTATTDDGTTLTLRPSYAADWATVADTTYRALLYHRQVTDGTTSVISLRRVTMTPIVSPDTDVTIATDPLDLESVWVGKNKRYLNMALKIKTGATEGEKQLQQVAVVCDSVTQLANGKAHHWLTLFHKQNNQPEYYTSKVYVSVPLDHIASGDSITLKVNTYKGMISKEIEK